MKTQQGEPPSPKTWRAAKRVITAAREARNMLEHKKDHVAHPERCPGCKVEAQLDEALADFDERIKT